MITKKEKVLLAFCIFIIILIVIFPHLYGYINQSENKQFTSLIGHNPHDQAYYLGWGAKQVEKGHILLEDKFNGYYDHKRRAFNPLWLIMGLSAKLFDISVITAFNIERVLSSIFLLIVIYILFSKFIEKPSWRIFALLLISFSSGFGLFQIPVDKWASPLGIFSIPGEMWTPDLCVNEASIFFTMLWEVNLPLATSLFLLSIYFGYKTLFINDKFALKAGVMTLILGLIYPYGVISTYFILGGCILYKIMKGNSFKAVIHAYIKIVLISIPIVLYDGYIIITNLNLLVDYPVSPNLFKYFLGFGIVSIFALAGNVIAILKRENKYSFLIIWTVVTFYQIYIPQKLIPFQITLIVGIQVPLIIMAIYCISGIWKYLKNKYSINYKKFRLILILILILLLFFSSVTNIFKYRTIITRIKRHSFPEYIDLKTKEAFDWLAYNSEDHELVLSSSLMAAYIPLFAYNRIYCSKIVSNRPYKKELKIQWLFDRNISKKDNEILNFLKKNKIDYIFYDQELFKSGGDEMKKRFVSIPQLVLKFDNGKVSIFQFKLN